MTNTLQDHIGKSITTRWVLNTYKELTLLQIEESRNTVKRIANIYFVISNSLKTKPKVIGDKLQVKKELSFVNNVY